MSSRVEQLAQQFESANTEVIDTVTACTDAQWKTLCAGEGWSVGVVALHIAGAERFHANMIGVRASGETLPPRTSMDEIHEGNAANARDNTDVTPVEVLDRLQRNGADAARQIRALRDDDLDRVAGIFLKHEMTVADVVENMAIGHARRHLESIRQTIDA